jgi:SAM-dependent methyltransferase
VTRQAPLEILPTYEDMTSLLTASVQELGRRRGALEILEAGCGRKWPLLLDGVTYRLTGVDLDPHSLEHRKNGERDLHEAILGDLREVSFPDGRFDVIYSSFVLEHIVGAEGVLDRFGRWLKDGGLLLLVIPDRDSVWGFVARVTPFWFHVFFKRYVQGHRDAGKPGHAPYPTVHDPVVSRKGLRRYCRDHGLTMRHECGRQFRPKRFGALVRVTIAALHVLSLGALAKDHSDLVLVLQKGGPVEAAP